MASNADGIEDCVLRAEKFRQLVFEILVDVLRAANETDRRHAEAVGVERLFRRGDERRMIGQPEIIVRAHVEDAPAARDPDLRVLRRGDDAFGFVEALRPDFGERVGESADRIPRA